jgi:hypothetical protein
MTRYVPSNIRYDTLYTASLTDTLKALESDAKCRIVAYDEPVQAVKHFSTHSKCTLFVLRSDGFKAIGSCEARPIYVYTGPGRLLTLTQKITLSPQNYLYDWCFMNRVVDNKL